MAQTDTAFPSLNIEQVAGRLGISTTTLFRMLALGAAPPSYKVGKRRLWHERDVLEWLETECRQSSGEGRC
jgi:excisionase family DNA binding protein